MRLIGSFIVGCCVLAMLSGCTTDFPYPSEPITPSGSQTLSPSSAEACTNPDLATTPVSEMTWNFTEIRRRDPDQASSGSLGDLILDEPAPEILEWDSTSDWATSNIGINDQVAALVGASQGASRANVDSIIENDTAKSVTDVAYVVQATQRFSVNLTCNDGRRANGTWTGPVRTETGVLTCGLAIPNTDDTNKRAIEAQSTYC